MKIIKAKYEIRNIDFNEPIKVSFGTISSTESMFLTITLEDGTEGFGEVANIEYITKVSNNQVNLDLEKEVPTLVGKDIKDFKNIIENLNERINMPALCAIDMALWDAYAKLANMPLSKVISPNVSHSKPTNYTIGILSKEDTLDTINKFLSVGKKNIKIKVGADIDKDIETINYSLNAIPNLKLRVDANQGYDEEKLKRFMTEIDQSRIILIEEPFPAGEYNKLAKAQQEFPDAFFLADETCSTVKDAQELAKRNACKGFNIKLVKCGGILNALKINEIAKNAGIKSMFGCMTESRLALSAAANLMFSDDNFVACDLDAHTFLKDNGGIVSNINFNDSTISTDGHIAIGVKRI